MTSTTDHEALSDELAEMRRQVRVLIDRGEIDDLITRFSRDLDDRTLAEQAFDTDWARAYFTEDATVDYPVGTSSGARAIAELIGGSGMAPFQRSHHLTANHLIEVDGDRAATRFNLIATHIHTEPERMPFWVGDYYEGELVRTSAGWRFIRQALHVTWTHGSPPS